MLMPVSLADREVNMVASAPREAIASGLDIRGLRWLEGAMDSELLLSTRGLSQLVAITIQIAAVMPMGRICIGWIRIGTGTIADW